MKKLFILPVLLLSLALAACSTPEEPTAQSGAQGKAVFTVSDAAAEMGTVSDVQVTIDALRIRAESGTWTVIDIEDQTFMLIELRDSGAAGLLAETELEAGTYDRLELQISNVAVIDAEGEHEAKLPGNRLQLEGLVEVEADATATADFDFLVDQSLHLTGEGTYVFAPVILLEARANADVAVRQDNTVVVSGGAVSTRESFGMDVFGNVAVGLRITPDAELSIGANGRVQQTAGQALLSGMIKNVDLQSGTVTVSTSAGGDITVYLASDSMLKIDGATKTAAELESAIGSRVNLGFNASSGAVTSLAAGASTEARAEAVTTLRASGVIVSVDSANETVTVRTDSGSNVVLHVDADSTIKLGSSLLSGLLGLNAHVGSDVEVTYEAGTNTVVEMGATATGEASAKATMKGELQAVNRLNGTITVIGESGKSLVLSIPASTKVIVDGSLSTLASLAEQIGAEIMVTYDTKTSAVSEFRAESDGTIASEMTLEGTLQGVNTLSGTVTVLSDSGMRTAFTVKSGTKVTIDGMVTGLLGLVTQIGVDVAVRFDPNTMLASSLTAQSSGSVATEATVHGTLKAVAMASGTMTVVSRQGSEVILRVGPSTRVFVDGMAKTFAEAVAHIGAGIEVTYDVETNVAQKIAIESSGSATAEGSLQAIDTAASTVTVLTESGVELVLELSAATELVINGSMASTVELAAMIGSQVAVQYDAKTKVAERIEAKGNASGSVSVTGTLKSVNMLSGTITLMASSGAETTVRVVPQTKIMINGTAGTMVELVGRTGSQITVHLDADARTATSINVG